MSPQRSPGYARPRARASWYAGTFTCGEIGIEPADALAPAGTLAEAARRMAGSQAGFLPVCEEGRVRGAVYLDDLLRALGEGADALNTPVATVESRLIPTVTCDTLLADAVRLMTASYLRRVPLVEQGGRLLGFVTLSEAAALADRDPAVREAFEQLSLSPSLWARRFR